jgi:uncharacterized iron-regulated membrane protein
VIREETRNVFIIVGGSIGMFLVLIGGFFLLCGASWALMWGMNWSMVQVGLAPPFGNEHGPVGLEVILGAFLILSLRRLTRIARPED